MDDFNYRLLLCMALYGKADKAYQQINRSGNHLYFVYDGGFREKDAPGIETIYFTHPSYRNLLFWYSGSMWI